MCSRPAPLGPPRRPRSVPTVTRKVCGGDRGDRVVVAQGRLTVFRTPTQQGIDAVRLPREPVRTPDSTTVAFFTT